MPVRSPLCTDRHDRGGLLRGTAVGVWVDQLDLFVRHIFGDLLLLGDRLRTEADTLDRDGLLAGDDTLTREDDFVLLRGQVAAGHHVAGLARIHLSDEELDTFAGQLDSIVGFVASVNEAAADDIPPMSHPLPLTNVTRPDEVRPSLTADEALSGGNFHAEPVAFAADMIALAICEIGSIAERRIAMLVDPALSGLPAFLTPKPGLNSGFMIPQVTAAALVSENKQRA